MEDTLENRFKAIHAISAMDGEHIAGSMLSLEKMGKGDLQELLQEASQALNNIYNLAHGWESSCCKGKGSDLIEPAIKAYYGENPTE